MGSGLDLIRNRIDEGWLNSAQSKLLNDELDLLHPQPPVISKARTPWQLIAAVLLALEEERSLILPPPGITSEILEHSADQILKLPKGSIAIATGGTSGRPRFAIHSKKNFLSSINATASFFALSRFDPCCCLPLYHVSGLMQVLRSFYGGGHINIASWKNVEAGDTPDQCKQISLVPTQLHRLLKNSSSVEWLRRMDCIHLGGAPASNSVLRPANEHSLKISPCYGMTETASMIAAQLPGDFNGKVRLRLLPHADVSIESENQSDEGRLRIKADSLCSHYISGRQIHPLRDSLQSDDLGRIDSTGELYIIGRVDGLINTGGEKADPLYIQSVIMDTGLAIKALVSGVKSEEWYQAVHCSILLQDNASLPQLRKLLRHELPPHMLPKSYTLLNPDEAA